eukprot:EG_transcript_11281
MAFHETGLSPWLCRVCESLGMRQPTPVQKAAIPLILQGKQVCASAATGGGKTAAFVLPILHTLAQDPYGVYAVIVTPSRELAQQIRDNVVTFGSSINVKHALLVGGLGMFEQMKTVRSRPHIVIGTPGRLYGALEGPDSELVFKKVRYLVLDEADMLLRQDFFDQVERVCLFLPPRKLTLFFSATIDESMKDRIARVTGQPVEYIVNAGTRLPPNLEERCLWLPPVLCYAYLAYVLRPEVIPAKSVIVFTVSRKKTEMVRLTLQALGVSVTSISGNQPQKVRFRNLKRFRAGKHRVLVATDLASRGLDLPTVDLVVNFDLPATPEDYIHRVGRTARAGRAGVAVTFLFFGRRSLRQLDALGSKTGSNFQEYKLLEDDVSRNLSEVTQARLKAEKQYTELYGKAEDEAQRLEEIAELLEEPRGPKRAAPAAETEGPARPRKKRKRAPAGTSPPAP